MIGRPGPVEVPERSGQNAVGEFVAFPPPLVPNAAHIMVGARLRACQFHRQQAADAEQAGLQGERLSPGRLPARVGL